MVEYIVSLFGNQFTVDEFYDGIEVQKMLSTIIECVNDIVDRAGKAVGSDPNNPNM
ncbi:hypothetical protein D3C73_1601580 [compost metagenome]